MPYISPKPSSVQWQAQTRRRSAPHSPTLRPRTTPPDSVEDLSFTKTDTADKPLSLPPFTPLSQPTTQRPQSPTSPKLPVSNASATKSRSPKDRLPTSTPIPAESKTPEPQTASVLLYTEAPVRKHKPKDPSRLTNGVGKFLTNGTEKPVANKVDKPLVNGVEKPLVNGYQSEPVASTAPQLPPIRGVETSIIPPQVASQTTPSQPPQAARDSDDHGLSSPEDLEKAVVKTSDGPESTPPPVETKPKESGIKRFLLRILSCCDRDRPQAGQ